MQSETNPLHTEELIAIANQGNRPGGDANDEGVRELWGRRRLEKALDTSELYVEPDNQPEIFGDLSQGATSRS